MSSQMLDAVMEGIIRSGHISPGDRGVVAFSGGPDSLCLLDLLWRMREELQLDLAAAIVDHGLRSASAAEARQARQMAESMGVRAVILLADGIRARGGNLQQEARQARLQLLEEFSTREGASWVALGHTASDQAETVIMRVVRGAGVAGLGGIAERSGPFIRPLLHRSRGQIEQYLSERGLSPLHDPSNSTDRYFRNRVRRNILPMLELENPQVTEAICRLARTCREEDATLDQLAAQALGPHRTTQGVDLRFLPELPRGLQLRVTRLILAEARGDLRGIDRRHVELLSEMIHHRAGHSYLDLPGIQFQRQYQQLSWKKNSELPLATLEIFRPGRYQLSNGLYLHVKECSSRDHVGAANNFGQALAISIKRLTLPVIIRSWRNGDRIAIGPNHRKKVARMMMDAKIPRDARAGVPLVTSAGDVILVVGIRRAYGYAPGKSDVGWTIALNGE